MVAGGDMNLALGRALANARRYMRQTRSLFETLHPNMSPDRADLLVSLARAQLALGRVEDAVASAGQAATFWRTFDARNRRTEIATLWHARALHAAGQTQKPAALRR